MNRLWQWLALTVCITTFLAGCGGGDGGFFLPAPANSTTALVASPGDSQIALDWPQVAKATAYKVYRGTAPGVTKASPTNFTSTTNKYVDTSVSNGTTYYYMVTPIDSTGEGAASHEASATPQLNSPPFAPTDVYAWAAPTSIDIIWTPPPGATSYNVYYGTAPGVTKQSTKVNVTFGFGIVSGLTNGTKYYLAMTAVNANGESPLSVEVSATPGDTGALSGPTPTATAGNNKVDLSWSGIVVPGSTISYNIYMATCSPVIPGPGTLVASGITGTSTTITSLNPGTTYYFVMTVVFNNTETMKSNEVSATPTASSRGSFSQSDLIGTWNIIHFEAGPDVTAGNTSAWLFGTQILDASGNITFSNLVTNLGPLSNPGPAKWIVNADGTINESGTAAFGPDTHLIMSASKEIIVGTSNDATNRLIRIAVKQNTAANFTSADIASKNFVVNLLDSGASNIWRFETASTDASGLVTINTDLTPNGPSGGFPQTQGILTVDSNGLVSNNVSSAFHGIMTPDKKVLFFVNTTGSGNSYTVGAISITGQSFATSDLAGTWLAHGLASSSTIPDWERATLTLNSSGAGTVSNVVDASTGPTPGTAPLTATLTSTGAFGIANEPDVYGFMSYNKDILVFTSTWTPGTQYALYVTVK